MAPWWFDYRGAEGLLPMRRSQFSQLVGDLEAAAIKEAAVVNYETLSWQDDMLSRVKSEEIGDLEAFERRVLKNKVCEARSLNVHQVDKESLLG
jgi:hypothetical protein